MTKDVKLEREPYPLDALSDTVRAAVEEVQGFTQAPTALVASCALATLSLAGQALGNVKRLNDLIAPIGMYFLTIAKSGERKSTCAELFMKVIREFDAAGSLKPERPLPLRPKLIYADVTIEALKDNLTQLWPSGGYMSGDAGVVFGSRAMSKGYVQRTLETCIRLWDDGEVNITDSFTMDRARFTIGLLGTKEVFQHFVDRSGGLIYVSRFLNRFLISEPESTMGTRMETDAPESSEALEKYNQRIIELLNEPLPIVDGSLMPPVYSLSEDADDAWLKFYNDTERRQLPGSDLSDISPIAGKAADNAARLATLFQIFEHGAGDTVGLKAFEGAAKIVTWHLNEAKRFYGDTHIKEIA